MFWLPFSFPLFSFSLSVLLLLLPLLLLPLLLPLVVLSLPGENARLPVPPLASEMLVPPSASIARSVAFDTVPPLTATHEPVLFCCAASTLEVVTTPRFKTTTAAVAIEKNRDFPTTHPPSIVRVDPGRSRPVRTCHSRSCATSVDRASMVVCNVWPSGSFPLLATRET